MDYEWNVSPPIFLSVSSDCICTSSFADYFTVGCKTRDGLTVILVERGPGVNTKQIKTSYSTTAGTAYITFDNVKVPVENTLGEEGGGIFVILRYLVTYSSYLPSLILAATVISTTNDGSCVVPLPEANGVLVSFPVSFCDLRDHDFQ